MDWACDSGDAKRSLLAQALLDEGAASGLSRRTLARTAESVLGPDADLWREWYPRGTVDAIWHISEVSDSSMRAAFNHAPARAMREVFEERFRQNQHLKRFVWRVMMFDLVHPFQALRRMQRTARVMLDCLERAPARDRLSVTALNLAYTIVVFAWLLDGGGRHGLTDRVMGRMLRIIGLD